MRAICCILFCFVYISACSKNQADVVKDEASSSTFTSDISTSSFDTINTVMLSPEELQSLTLKGEYLTKIAACGSCHGASTNSKSPLSGGRTYSDEIGEIVVPNITSDVASGIGSWSIGDLKKAIREGIGKGGRLLSPRAHSSYRWMSDEDALGISIYLTKTEPRKNKIAYRNVSSFDNKKWGLISQHSEIVGYVPNLPEKSAGYRGLYLVSFVQNCARCHSPGETMADKKEFLDGFTGILPFSDSKEEVVIPSIRDNENGLKSKSESDIISFLSRVGVQKGCPTEYYAHMTDTDKKSVAVYLKSLK